MKGESRRDPARTAAAIQALLSKMKTPSDIVEQLNAVRLESLRGLTPVTLLKEILPSIEHPLSEFFDRLREDLKRQRPTMERVARDMIAQMEQDMITLAELGWYVDMWIITKAEIHVLARKVRNGETADVEEHLVAFYTEHLDTIEQELQKRQPARSALLTQAFGAHRREEYALSTPVFLAQADGVCFERIGQEAYGRRRGTPPVAPLVAAIASSGFAEAVLAPLTSPMPISDSTSGELKTRGLNRHAILHGLDVHYGTKPNSLKAALFLLYVSELLGEPRVGRSDGEVA